jgi:hypothetical protein
VSLARTEISRIAKANTFEKFKTNPTVIRTSNENEKSLFDLTVSIDYNGISPGIPPSAAASNTLLD